MAEVTLQGSQLGNALYEILMGEDITPGDSPSYQLCKTILTAHPLGRVMAEKPIVIAQSQEREISIQRGPEDRLKEAFENEWRRCGADKTIRNTATLARAYGLSSVAMVSDELKSEQPVDFETLADVEIGFNVLDPLNTAGSLLLNQNPNDPKFQHVSSIASNGKAYHRSKTVTLLNEDPIYLDFISSTFAYSGRSVYQRPLFPLKSFIWTMLTDDMVAFKAGVLIEKQEQNSSAVDSLMEGVAALKRQFVKQARVGNVITIGLNEEIESIDLKNLAEPYGMSRKNILDNIATGGGMPAIMLNQETFAEGLSDGTEDSKMVAQYVDFIRIWLGPLYEYFDKIVQYRAWNPRFYKTIQHDFPEYKDVSYNEAFYEWRNNFRAKWPSLLKEPDSELAKVDDVKLKALIAWVQVMTPMLDPLNKVAFVQTAVDCINGMNLLFSSPFILDTEALMDHLTTQAENMAAASEDPDAAPPFSARDAMEALSASVSRLPERRRVRG